MNHETFFVQDTADAQAIVIGAALVVILLVLCITLLINIAICAVLYSAFLRIPPEHRRMQPGQVWLLLIPLFSYVWNFFVFQQLPDSFKSYFDAQGRADVDDCGRGVGLWYAISAVATLVPCVNYVAGPAALVLLVIFLVKVFDLRGRIPIGPVAA